jgi:hypothetical protein
MSVKPSSPGSVFHDVTTVRLVAWDGQDENSIRPEDG